MGVRNIVQVGDPALRKKCKPVERFDERLFHILDDMAETMYENSGVGLAAPQIAILRRLVVMDCGDGLIEMINPQIVKTDGEQVGEEGCLSVLGRKGMVKRPLHVVVRYQDRNNSTHELEGEGLLARCIMHEIDHLDGRIYTDIMEYEIIIDESEKGNDEN